MGYLIGSNVANAVQVSAGEGAATDWASFWLLPAGFAAITALAFLLLFRDRRGSTGAPGSAAAPSL